jgi:hypothetical protein
MAHVVSCRHCFFLDSVVTLLSSPKVLFLIRIGPLFDRTDLDNVEKAMEPLVDSEIYVVNEAYSLLHGWAEGSLKLADRTCFWMLSIHIYNVYEVVGSHLTS